MAQRKGQATFRRRLVKSVGQCEATMSQYVFATDACHIKPHNICNEDEAIDPNNALLLLASIHRAFDKGFVSFDDDGKILISSSFDSWDRQCFGITGNERIRMPGKRPEYMKYHRENIFKP
jgi:hypothetical protein